MTDKKRPADHYELRKGREVICRGTVKNLGYTNARLKEMAKEGIRLFKNGELVKRCQLE